MSYTIRVFLSGLLALLPVALTVFVVVWLASLLNEYVGPGSWLGRQLATLGLSVSETSPTPYILGIVVLLVTIYVLRVVLHHRLCACAMRSGLLSMPASFPRQSCAAASTSSRSMVVSRCASSTRRPATHTSLN